MTLDGWRKVVAKSAQDAILAELLAQLLTEQDTAKNALIMKGYGCTGIPWLELVAEIPHGT